MYEYRATLVRVVDGDTVDLDVDVGFHITVRERFRLSNIDAPEVRGEEREEGHAASDHLEKLLKPAVTDDDCTLIVQTAKQGSFRRWLGTLVLRYDDGRSVDINSRMVLDGHATTWR